MTQTQHGSDACLPTYWKPDDIFDERLGAIKRKIDLVRRRIASREELGKKTIKDLEERLCEFGSEIYILEELPCNPESIRGKAKSRLAIARANVEKELQAERLGIWRDLYELEAEALQLQEECVKIVRRRGLLDEDRRAT